jgi:ferric-dicitrate binding protein FerR (iron transport regulator)
MCYAFHAGRRAWGLLLSTLMLQILGEGCQTTPKSPAAENEETSYTVRETSAGQMASLTLEDSTRVTLNSHTQLRIPQDFSASRRVLSLDGDAYFVLPPTASHPLVLHTGMLNLIGRDAAFRVYAHRSQAGQSVEVLHGTLRVEKAYPSDYPDTAILGAGDMVMINQDIDLMEKETFDTATLSQWVRGELILDHASWNQVVKKLEDWYDMEVQVSGYQSSAPQPTFHATFHRASLQTVMDSLKQIQPFRYKLKNNTLEISL